MTLLLVRESLNGYNASVSLKFWPQRFYIAIYPNLLSYEPRENGFLDRYDIPVTLSSVRDT